MRLMIRGLSPAVVLADTPSESARDKHPPYRRTSEPEPRRIDGSCLMGTGQYSWVLLYSRLVFLRRFLARRRDFGLAQGPRGRGRISVLGQRLSGSGPRPGLLPARRRAWLGRGRRVWTARKPFPGDRGPENRDTPPTTRPQTRRHRSPRHVAVGAAPASPRYSPSARQT